MSPTLDAATLVPMDGEEDIETRALRRQQEEIAEAASEGAERASTDEEAHTLDRRAEKAEYLKQKLEERAEAERAAEIEDAAGD